MYNKEVIKKAIKHVFPQSIIENDRVKYNKDMENWIPLKYASMHVFVQMELTKSIYN